MNKPCSECGKLIPPDKRSNAAVCSESCRVVRKNRKALERHHAVKHTPEYQAQRRRKYEKLKADMAADPEFAADERRRHQEAVKRYTDRKMQDPEYRARLYARRREEQKRYLKRKKARDHRDE